MSEAMGGWTAALGVAVGSGAVAATSPPAPTGRPVVDAVMVGLAVGAVTLVGASAPWWLLVVLGAVAVAAGGAGVVVAVAAVGLALALVVGWRHIEAPAVSACSAAISLNALAWAEMSGFFGLTSIVAVGAGLVVLVGGLMGVPSGRRRPVVVGIALVAAVGIVGLAGLAMSARQAQDDLEAGRRAAERGIDALRAGELHAAVAEFDGAATAFGSGQDHVRSPVARLAGFVPVAAQHRAALVELTGQGVSASQDVAAALREIDLDELRLREGRIDVEAVGSLADPLRRVEGTLETMRLAIGDTGSPWLIDAVTDRLDELEEELAARAPQLRDAVRSAELAPQLLGAGDARQYLVLFTTPSEARGLGGFVGNYAQLDIVDGRITMPRFGRVRDLEEIDEQIGTVIGGPSEYLERYADFCCSGSPGGRVGDAAWRNLTVTPHFPWVGEIAVDMYRQETGVDLDGVLVVDPYVVEALLAYTGPIELASVGVTIDGDNAAEFLLRGQYRFTGDANTERIDALEEAAQGTFGRLLAGNLPDPVQMVQDLGPLVEQRRFLVWTTDADEQELLRRVGLLGEMPPLAGGDGWSVALSNGGGNKIDAFLEGAVSYESATGTDGTTSATLRVELTNTAPASGLPKYVIGNLVDLPAGTSRLHASFYTALDVAAATVDGAPLELRRGSENEWKVYSASIDIAAGETATIELQLVGELADPSRVTTWAQPLVRPLVVQE